MSLKTVLLVVVLAGVSTHIATGNLDTSYQIIRVTSGCKESLKNVLQQVSKDYNADVLFGGMNAAEVMVTSDKVDDVTRSIKRAGTEFQIVVKDAQRMLNDDYRRRMSKSRKGATDVKNSYLGLKKMKRFLRRVKREATEADVSLYSMGKSFEGRKMPVVTIREKDGDRKRETKPAIVIDAGIHAREWIAPAMALNIVNKLALNPDNDDEVKDMLQMFDWFIAPIVNPDGYAYSRAKPESRLWRKTRSDKHMNGTGCVGVDANRNFGFDWNPESGASSDPCSPVFAGPAPFSEPETRNIRDWLKKLSDRTALFLTLHAFSQVVLTPPGANPNRTLDNQEDAMEVGNAFAAVVNATGRPYIVGGSAELLYPASGTTMDYAWGGAAIPLSYTIELSPSFYFDEFPDNNFFLGFLYPEEKLADTVEATWQGFKAMARAVDCIGESRRFG